jgi:N-acetylmuramoyl-L-alanine amidase
MDIYDQPRDPQTDHADPDTFSLEIPDQLRYYYRMVHTPTPLPRPRTQARAQSPKIFQTTLAVAVALATLFTAWTPAGLFSGDMTGQLSVLLTAQPEQGIPGIATPRPKLRIGIVSGHWGNDSGAVCPDNTTEADVNLKIATLVQQKLTALGFQTDLLQEFDPRLEGYRAAVLVSIHNDSCEYVNDQASGFKVAAAMSSRDINLANRLAGCMRDRYQRTTGLPWHDSVTNDMRYYHSFEELDPATTSAIIETGFLNLDYNILTQQPDLIATGVVNGILCFVNNENIVPVP